MKISLASCSIPLVLFFCLAIDVDFVQGRLATQESSSCVRSARARRRALLGEELRQLSKVPNAKLVVRAAKIRKGRRPKTFPRKRKDDDDQTRRQAAYENRKKKDRQIKEFAESGIGLGGMWVKTEDPIRRTTMNLIAAVNDIKEMQAKRGFKYVPHRPHPTIQMAYYNVVASLKTPEGA